MKKRQTMGWMRHSFSGWWLCYLFFSMGTSEEPFILGDPEDCTKAEFVPGYNLGGESFDIVKMERKGSYVIDMETWDLGNGSCKMKKNVYLKNQMQKVPVAVVYWRTLPKCSHKASSKIFESSEALVKDTTSAVSNNWKVGLSVPIAAGVSLGGTHSREATYGMKKSKEDKFSFTKHEVQCSFYSYKITSVPPLHPEFLQAVKLLPPVYDKHSYQSIIDMYGTHYIIGVKLGGKMKAVTSIKVCVAALEGLKDTAVKNCLSVEASGTYQSVTLSTEFRHCNELKKRIGKSEKFSSMFNDRQTEIIGGDINGEDLLFSSTSHPKAYAQWVASLKTIPDIVSYTLQPLHLLLNNKHPAKRGLKKAIENYIVQNSLKQMCSKPCKLGTHSSSRDRCVCTCESNPNIMSNCCPGAKGLATLKVFKLYAIGLFGDVFTKTDGTVQVLYGGKEEHTSVINENDNPRWPESFDFGPIKISMGSKITFKVYDADSKWNSDLLGTCSRELRRGEVRGECSLNHGTFFYSYNVECAPSLQGQKCESYQPSPMDAPLADIFTSRNGILVKDMWKLQSAFNNSNKLPFNGYL